jgi:hypothetical protein
MPKRVFVACEGKSKCSNPRSIPGCGLHCACVGDGKSCCYCGFKFKDDKKVE